MVGGFSINIPISLGDVEKVIEKISEAEENGITPVETNSELDNEIGNEETIENTNEEIIDTYEDDSETSLYEYDVETENTEEGIDIESMLDELDDEDDEDDEDVDDDIEDDIEEVNDTEEIEDIEDIEELEEEESENGINDIEDTDEDGRYTERIREDKHISNREIDIYTERSGREADEEREERLRQERIRYRNERYKAELKEQQERIIKQREEEARQKEEAERKNSNNRISLTSRKNDSIDDFIEKASISKEEKIESNHTIEEYNKMSDTELFDIVKIAMIKSGVKKKPVQKSKLIEVFGKDSLNRLHRKGYLIFLGEKVTMGIK